MRRLNGNERSVVFAVAVQCFAMSCCSLESFFPQWGPCERSYGALNVAVVAAIDWRSIPILGQHSQNMSPFRDAVLVVVAVVA